MPFPTIDLRSDTVTRPTEGMREAMAAAPVGDDVFGEDPTLNALQERVATMTGKEAALFVPSGTMANLVATLAQTRPGESVILCEDAHPYQYEAANIAVVGGLLTCALPGHLGMITAEEIAPRIVRNPDHHLSQTSLISVENTTNRGGGNLYELDALAAIATLAREDGLRVHCDGARIFNAVVRSGVSLLQYAQHVDTMSFCFSKGLGAPVGSIVVGPAETIDRMHFFRKMLGGGMRQAGILAAAALYALDHHVDRLAEDHRRAEEFRSALEPCPGVEFPMPTPTNIVMMDVSDAQQCVHDAAEKGVLLISMGPKRVRAVFHLDIDDAGLGKAIDVCTRLLG